MSKERRQFTADFKFKVALEAAKGTKAISQISSETGVHPNQISQWKHQLLEEGASLFKKMQPNSSASKSKWKPSCMSKSDGSKWSWNG